MSEMKQVISLILLCGLLTGCAAGSGAETAGSVESEADSAALASEADAARQEKIRESAQAALSARDMKKLLSLANEDSAVTADSIEEYYTHLGNAVDADAVRFLRNFTDALPDGSSKASLKNYQEENSARLFIPPAERWHYPTAAIGEKENQYHFGIEVWNTYGETVTVKSLLVEDFMGDTAISSREITGRELENHSASRSAKMVLQPGTPEVLFDAAAESEVNFDRRFLTAVLQGTSGTRYTQTYKYTMHREEEDPSQELWIPGEFMEDGFWHFNTTFTNGSASTLKLQAVYYINYFEGVPLRIWHPVGADLYSHGFSDFQTVYPGETVCRVDGNARETYVKQRRDYYIFRDENNNQVVFDSGFVYGPEYEDNAYYAQLALERYDNLNEYYALPASMGAAQYTKAQLQAMVDGNLSLDEVADKLSTYDDVMHYLFLRGYHPDDLGPVAFHWNGQSICINRSAWSVFRDNHAGCGGTSNLINYLLRGDYDEQGYILESYVKQGHIYNYFRKGTTYYVVDFTRIMGAGDFDAAGYKAFEGSSLQEFSDTHIAENHHKYSATENDHTILLYSFRQDDGPHCAMRGYHFDEVSRNYQDAITQLFSEGLQVRFADLPAQASWPTDAQYPGYENIN